MSTDMDYQRYTGLSNRPLKQQSYSPFKCFLESLTYYESKFNFKDWKRTDVFDM